MTANEAGLAYTAVLRRLDLAAFWRRLRDGAARGDHFFAEAEGGRAGLNE